MNLDLSIKKQNCIFRFLSHFGVSLLLLLGFGVLSYAVNQRNQEALVNSIQAIFRNDRDIGNNAHLYRRVADLEAMGIIRCVRISSQSLGEVYSTNFKDGCTVDGLRDRLMNPRATSLITSIDGDRFEISFKSESNFLYRFYIGLFFVLSLIIANLFLALYWIKMDMKAREFEREHELNRVLDKKVQRQANELVSIRLEAAIQQSNAELGRRVAHDIRSPLSALLSLVHNHDNLDKDYYKDTVEQVATRISTIADDLLVRAKQAVRHESRRFRLKETLIRLIDEKKIEYINSLRLQCDVDVDRLPSDVYVRFPEIEFSRIVSNVFNNAVEALKTDGRVSIMALCEGPQVLIKIADNGVGIVPDVLSKLMTEEVTTKEHGSGIGILFSAKVLNQYGHSLRIMSEVDRGTEVQLIFNPPFTE